MQAQDVKPGQRVKANLFGTGRRYTGTVESHPDERSGKVSVTVVRYTARGRIPVERVYQVFPEDIEETP